MPAQIKAYVVCVTLLPDNPDPVLPHQGISSLTGSANLTFFPFPLVFLLSGAPSNSISLITSASSSILHTSGLGSLHALGESRPLPYPLAPDQLLGREGRRGGGGGGRNDVDERTLVADIVGGVVVDGDDASGGLPIWNDNGLGRRWPW